MPAHNSTSTALYCLNYSTVRQKILNKLNFVYIRMRGNCTTALLSQLNGLLSVSSFTWLTIGTQ